MIPLLIRVAHRPISAKYLNECERPGFDKIRLTAICCQVGNGLRQCPQSRDVHQLQLHPGAFLFLRHSINRCYVYMCLMVEFFLRIFLYRLSDMQFSFRQQSGPAATTNTEQEPSFVNNKKTESTVSIVASNYL